MKELINSILSIKLLESCGCNINSAFYCLIPNMDETIRLHTQNLHDLPRLLDSSMEIFLGKNTRVAKNTVCYLILKKNQEKYIKLFNNTCEFAGYGGQKSIGQNKIEAALGYISGIYFNTYLTPIQFFLPHSSVCSGRWEFWDSTDFFSFEEKLQNKEFIFAFRDKIMENKTWDLKFDLDMFPEIVRRRLIKEEPLNKKLNPASVIKAIIIRMGEMGRPFINYEVIDFSIRELFTYLGEKKYLRVDREIEFLRKLDNEIKKAFKECMEELR